MVCCCLAAAALCGLCGLFSGAMVTFFQVPAFIVTLAMMLVARGLASEVSRGASIYQVPASFLWLGGGADLLGIPNGVLLMIVLYVAADVVMTRMTMGRYIYALGGNAEAARLSGVPVRRVLLLVYTLSGILAGVGGIVMASRLRSGAPTYGLMYELYAIAAVVVGGASLSGGEGKMFGTLIGAFIIAVIKNGMNLTGVTPFRQDVVFGGVILGAVLLDRLKKYGGASWRAGSRQRPESSKPSGADATPLAKFVLTRREHLLCSPRSNSLFSPVGTRSSQKGVRLCASTCGWRGWRWGWGWRDRRRADH